MIVTVALLPAVTALVYTEFRLRQERFRVVTEDVRRLLYAVSAEQQQVIDGGKEVVEAIIALPEIEDDLPQRCQNWLENLIRLSPRYNVASVINLDGTPRCSSHPINPYTNLSHRTYFRRALQSDGAAVGDFVEGISSGRPTLHVAKAFIGRDGKPAGVVTVGIDLGKLAERLGTIAAPSGAVLLIADRNGVILVRCPALPGFVGTSIMEQNRVLLSEQQIGTSMASARDGQKLLTAYSPPAANHNGLLILAGLDPASAFTPLLQANRDSLLLIVGSSVLALIMTTVVGVRLIRRPIDQLTAIAERWKTGDLTARTGLAGEPDEFGRLALSFETMAAALAAREAALQELTNNLEGRVRDEVAAREIAQTRAAQAERMQALGQLAGGVAHDINNVLHAISGAITLIERRLGDQSGIHRLTRIANDAIDRGISVTRRLLTFGRRGALQAQTIDVSNLLRNIEEILIYTLGANINIKILADDTVGSLTADRGQLETVLVNLATNARDAMAGGGRLVIAAEPETVQVGAVDATLGLAPGRYVRLSVTDTGTGMNAEILARARDPFFTTKPAGAGTGLGLAMAHGFAQQSGGALDLKSEVGKGTTVTLWLPAAETDRDVIEVETDSAIRLQDTPATPARILLVDDEATIREVFAEHLQDAGHDVLVACEGAEALATLDANRDIDVLITDLSMPGMDGLSLIRAAHRRRPELPAILVTGYAGSETTLALTGFVPDTVSLLRKPVTAVALLDHVDSVLAVRRTFPSFGPADRVEAGDGCGR